MHQASSGVFGDQNQGLVPAGLAPALILVWLGPGLPFGIQAFSTERQGPSVSNFTNGRQEDLPQCQATWGRALICLA